MGRGGWAGAGGAGCAGAAMILYVLVFLAGLLLGGLSTYGAMFAWAIKRGEDDDAE
jgi:hypothetical protein